MIDWRSCLIIMPQESLPPLSQAELEEFLPYQDAILEELHRREAPLPENASCHMCKESPAEYRCGTCHFFSEGVCKRCLLSHHKRVPLHNQVKVWFQFALVETSVDILQKWNGSAFEDTTWLPLASSLSSEIIKAARVSLHPTPKIS